MARIHSEDRRRIAQLEAELAAERAGAGSRKQLTELQTRIARLKATVRQAIEGHKVWESVYGSSPTSRAHLAFLEATLTPQETPAERHDLMCPGTCDRCGNPIDRPCSICPNHPKETSEKGEPMFNYNGDLVGYAPKTEGKHD
jgi:hypothetical protein